MLSLYKGLVTVVRLGSGLAIWVMLTGKLGITLSDPYFWLFLVLMVLYGSANHLTGYLRGREKRY